ncbi:MAG: translational machinery protein [Myxococcota bacterium]|nr:translational machinery protein [Myxococcota bacterium]
MNTDRHVAVWIDHKEARVFHVSAEGADAVTIRAPHAHVHRHPRGPEGAHEHPEDAARFFREVARALDGAEEILIVGPSTAKLELVKYLHKHEHALEPKIVGIETVDHPTDGQLVAYVQRYFRAADRMR